MVVTYNKSIREKIHGGIYMLELTISGFLAFLGSAIFVLGYISNNSLFPESLSMEDERMYVDKMEKGDTDAKNILIEHNLRLVAHVCKKILKHKHRPR